MRRTNYVFRSVVSFLLILFVLTLAGCSTNSVPASDAICTSGGTVRFAVIGDYGSGSRDEWGVSELVKRWKPDFVTTVGDNNYPEGSPDTIDKNIGRYYQGFISPYRGKYGPGAKVNRFFPIPGHRDWDTDALAPYLNYFELPGNERYYDFVAGPVHFFMLDTDTREPDGAVVGSVQARWLKQRLQASTSHWNLVYASHAPYTSHTVEDIVRMRWPFAEWGADALLSGYYHVYERLSIDGIPYFINGTGGRAVSYFGKTDPASKVRYRDNFGAMLVTADKSTICFDYYSTRGKRIDSFSVRKR